MKTWDKVVGDVLGIDKGEWLKEVEKGDSSGSFIYG